MNFNLQHPYLYTHLKVWFNLNALSIIKLGHVNKYNAVLECINTIDDEMKNTTNIKKSKAAVTSKEFMVEIYEFLKNEK